MQATCKQVFFCISGMFSTKTINVGRWKAFYSWVWWLMPVIATLGVLRQGDCQLFEASLLSKHLLQLSNPLLKVTAFSVVGNINKSLISKKK